MLVGRPGTPTPRTGTDRTSVSFTLDNTPGTLMQAMNEFAVRDINLSRIESRPTRTTLGTYRFHIDVAGHIDDPVVGSALAALYRRAENLRFLGSWPAAHGTAILEDGPPDVAAALGWVEKLKQGERD